MEKDLLYNVKEFVKSEPSKSRKKDGNREEKFLKKQAKRNEEREQLDHDLKQGINALIQLCLAVVIILVFTIIVFSIFSLGWHMLTNCPWLMEDKLDEVKNFTLSGALVSVGMTYFKKYIDN